MDSVSTNTHNRLDNILFLIHKTFEAVFEQKESIDYKPTHMKCLDAYKYKIKNIILQKKDNMSKLEYMLKVNNWMEPSFATSLPSSM